MRAATRKITHISHALPRAKKTSQLALIKARKLSDKSLRLMKKNPLLTLGAALTVSAASGLILWLSLRK